MAMMRNPAWLVLLSLAACTGAGTDVSGGPPCPNVAVIADTSVVTKFQPGLGRDLTDVILEARITDFDGFCDSDVDEGEGGEVQVEMRLMIEIERGPANAERRGAFEYFVAIGDSERNILAKEVFATEVAFEGNRSRMTTVEELVQTIPLRPGEFGGDYSIYVGFQLSEDELRYNRRKTLR